MTATGEHRRRVRDSPPSAAADGTLAPYVLTAAPSAGATMRTDKHRLRMRDSRQLAADGLILAPYVLTAALFVGAATKMVKHRRLTRDSPPSAAADGTLALSVSTAAQSAGEVTKEPPEFFPGGTRGRRIRLTATSSCRLAVGVPTLVHCAPTAAQCAGGLTSNGKHHRRLVTDSPLSAAVEGILAHCELQAACPVGDRGRILLEKMGRHHRRPTKGSHQLPAGGSTPAHCGTTAAPSAGEPTRKAKRRHRRGRSSRSSQQHDMLAE